MGCSTRLPNSTGLECFFVVEVGVRPFEEEEFDVSAGSREML